MEREEGELEEGEVDNAQTFPLPQTAPNHMQASDGGNSRRPAPLQRRRGGFARDGQFVIDFNEDVESPQQPRHERNASQGGREPGDNPNIRATRDGPDKQRGRGQNNVNQPGRNGRARGRGRPFQNRSPRGGRGRGPPNEHPPSYPVEGDTRVQNQTKSPRDGQGPSPDRDARSSPTFSPQPMTRRDQDMSVTARQRGEFGSEDFSFDREENDGSRPGFPRSSYKQWESERRDLERGAEHRQLPPFYPDEDRKESVDRSESLDPLPRKRRRSEEDVIERRKALRRAVDGLRLRREILLRHLDECEEELDRTSSDLARLERYPERSFYPYDDPAPFLRRDELPSRHTVRALPYEERRRDAVRR